MDIILINPGDKKRIYQDLAKDFAAIEPPFLMAVLSAYLRNKGFKVGIIDANADNISPQETALRVKADNPLLAAVIVYGANPSASTQNMTIANKICEALRNSFNGKIALGGLHPSALPKITLEERNADFVLEGEGAYTLEALLKVLKSKSENYSSVPGLWYYLDNNVCSNARAPLIENLDEVLPQAAWDLLSMDKYKAHNWHCFDDIQNRMPYGAIYTSLGCPYNCVFCCINAPFGKPGIRYRNPESVVKEIGLLVEKYGIKNLKIIDELFVLKESHYMRIVDLIIQKGYDLNMWAYARIDSIKFENLKRMKKAGINWLGLGIESASELVRDGVNKQMRKKDIKSIVRRIQDAGIRIGANYIFGLPDDTRETMQETLDFAIELNSELANFYCTMAYPGSRLYEIALEKGWELPKQWHGYSQYSYETLPLPTKYLSAKEVLIFRDEAFNKYYTSIRYLDMIEHKFGVDVKKHIEEMTKTKLKEGSSKMIISRTPFRISFFGGGTDYPAWFEKNGGAVLSTTIDKYCYISIRYLPPFFEHKHRIVYSIVEDVKSPNKIKHPVVKALLKYFKIEKGLEIHHDGDLPARAGLGSSSSFTVGMLNSLYALKGKIISKTSLAKEAIHIERAILKESVGSQDQIAVAHGGFNKIIFHNDHNFRIEPITLPKLKINQLQSHLMLIFTGLSRFASEIASVQISNTPKKEKELNAMRHMVDKSIEVLNNDRDIVEFGQLLHESWQIKKHLSSKVSNPEIDRLYKNALNHGAVGGKLLGAGGGGFMLLFVRPENRKKLKQGLKNYLEVKFSFENEGSQIIYYNP